MSYPVYIPTRVVTVGGAVVLESAVPLTIKATVTASRPLLWEETGFRFEKSATVFTSVAGEQLQIVLPVTDVAGWKDADTGALIDVSVEGSYTHRYVARLRFYDAAGKAVGGQYTIGPFVLPTGATPVDLDSYVPTSTVAGDMVSVPDAWGELVASAEAAAVAAASAAGDAIDQVVTDVADPETPMGGAVRTAVASTATTYTETQTFDETEGFAVGDKLKLSYVDGFFGQRLHLTGLPQPVGQPDIMPYLEVVPTTQTGTDVGGAIAGVQVYRTTGGGGVADREFLAIEASGNLASSPGFKIATWASGTGQVQPIRFVIGSTDIIKLSSDADGPRMTLGVNAQMYSTAGVPIFFERESGFPAIRARVAATANAGPWVFLGRNRGTKGAPTVPASGDILGDYRAGSLNGTTEAVGALMRALATETWAYGTNQGALLRFRVTPNGAASAIDVLDLKDPTDANDTALMVSVNRAGTKSVSRVAVGAADSGGTGFRMLRVAN